MNLPAWVSQLQAMGVEVVGAQPDMLPTAGPWQRYWAPDRDRLHTDPIYRAHVQALIASHIPMADLDSLIIVTDDQHRRYLVGRSFFDRDLNFNRWRGRVISATVADPLHENETLP